MPAHGAAGGKVLLAWRDRWRESFLARPLERITERTVTEARVLRNELDVVRRQGYAIEDRELEPKVCAVAAAIRSNGDVIAALSVSGRRLDLGAATPQVVQLAAELSADLSDG